MASSFGEAESDSGGAGQFEPGQRRRVRQMQRRMEIQMRATEAQRMAARATEKNARYLFWSVLMASVSTLVMAAVTVFVVIANLPHAAH